MLMSETHSLPGFPIYIILILSNKYLYIKFLIICILTWILLCIDPSSHLLYVQYPAPPCRSLYDPEEFFSAVVIKSLLFLEDNFLLGWKP